MVQTREKFRFSFYILWILFLCLLCICGNEAGVPQQFCNSISTLKLKFRNYFPHYLSMSHNETTNDPTSIYEEGSLYKKVHQAENKCCADPNIKVSFKWLDNVSTHMPLQFLVQHEQFAERTFSKYNDQLVFYFPEFADKGASHVYSPKSRFFRVLHSPGHVVLMRSADAKLGLDPVTILAPSSPLLAFLFTTALVVGIVVWFLVRLAKSFLKRLTWSDCVIIWQWTLSLYIDYDYLLQSFITTDCYRFLYHQVPGTGTYDIIVVTIFY